MEKFILAACVFLFGGAAGKAQTTTANDGGKFSIGVEAGLPLGNASDYSNLAIGGSLKYEYPVADSTFISLSGGNTEHDRLST